MSSTIHHSPTAYQQIKRILILLACAIGCGVAAVGLMLYTAQTERRYVLAESLIAPEVLPRIALHEPAHTWRFDAIELSFVDPTTGHMTTHKLTPSQYAFLYEALAHDVSLSDQERQHLEPTPFSGSMELTLWLKTDRPPSEHRILQTVLFFPNSDTYRVLLYQLDHSSPQVWATYRHKGLATLLDLLTKDTL